MILNSKASRVPLSDLESLITNQVSEGKYIDYKEALPGNSDSDKKEFLADVSSFANGDGGHLLFGCKERRENGSTTGLPETLCGLLGVSTDVGIARLGQIIRMGIDPRIQGVEIVAIKNAEDHPLILISIPRSYQSPHMVTFQNHSKFFSRSSTGKFQLDVSEIRRAFVASGTLEERLRTFSLERLGRIAAQETPIPLEKGIVVALHVLPFSSITADEPIDLSRLKNDARLEPLYTSSWGYRFNLDGWLVHSSYSAQRPGTSYLQVFRSGAIEAVMSYGEDEDHRIPSLRLEEMLLSALKRYVPLLNDIDRPAPYLVKVSLFGVKGARLAVNAFPEREHLMEKDELLLPEVLLEGPDVIDKRMNVTFDVLWQTAGLARSINFAVDGNWKPKR